MTSPTSGYINNELKVTSPCDGSLIKMAVNKTMSSTAGKEG
jgi:hypothetical protein